MRNQRPLATSTDDEVRVDRHKPGRSHSHRVKIGPSHRLKQRRNATAAALRLSIQTGIPATRIAARLGFHQVHTA